MSTSVINTGENGLFEQPTHVQGSQPSFVMSMREKIEYLRHSRKVLYILGVLLVFAAIGVATIVCAFTINRGGPAGNSTQLATSTGSNFGARGLIMHGLNVRDGEVTVTTTCTVTETVTSICGETSTQVFVATTPATLASSVEVTTTLATTENLPTGFGTTSVVAETTPGSSVDAPPTTIISASPPASVAPGSSVETPSTTVAASSSTSSTTVQVGVITTSTAVAPTSVGSTSSSPTSSVSKAEAGMVRLGWGALVGGGLVFFA